VKLSAAIRRFSSLDQNGRQRASFRSGRFDLSTKYEDNFGFYCIKDDDPDVSPRTIG
jgi:hypothetical protein